MLRQRILYIPWRKAANSEPWPLLAVDYDFRSAVRAYFQRFSLLLLLAGAAFTPLLLAWLIPLAMPFFTSLAVSIGVWDHPKTFGLLALVVVVVMYSLIQARVRPH